MSIAKTENAYPRFCKPTVFVRNRTYLELRRCRLSAILNVLNGKPLMMAILKDFVIFLPYAKEIQQKLQGMVSLCSFKKIEGRFSNAANEIRGRGITPPKSLMIILACSFRHVPCGLRLHIKSMATSLDFCVSCLSYNN